MHSLFKFNCSFFFVIGNFFHIGLLTLVNQDPNVNALQVYSVLRKSYAGVLTLEIYVLLLSSICSAFLPSNESMYIIAFFNDIIAPFNVPMWHMNFSTLEVIKQYQSWSLGYIRNATIVSSFLYLEPIVQCSTGYNLHVWFLIYTGIFQTSHKKW